MKDYPHIPAFLSQPISRSSTCLAALTKGGHREIGSGRVEDWCIILQDRSQVLDFFLKNRMVR